MTASDPRAIAYVVFAQGTSTEPDIAAWDGQARRFFPPTRLSPSAGDPGIVVVEHGTERAARRVLARACEDSDRALADEAERRKGGGLGLLARRCSIVWHVVRSGDDDLIALELAAILASIVLGPILDARVPELLGVKTARSRLARGVR